MKDEEYIILLINCIMHYIMTVTYLSIHGYKKHTFKDIQTLPKPISVSKINMKLKPNFLKFKIFH